MIGGTGIPFLVRQGEISIEPGYRAELLVSGLNFPTSMTFDDEGSLYVGESGRSYPYVLAERGGRILRLEPNGCLSEVASGFSGPVTSITWHRGAFYVAEGGYPGKITRVQMGGGRDVLVDGLRSGGDHFTSEISFGPDGAMYFGVGSATNSGVVGIDNYYIFEWLPLRPNFHDIPCWPVILRGKDYRSIDPSEVNPQDASVVTGAFHPFGEASYQGEIVNGQTLCNSVIYRANDDGSNLTPYLDGVRNTFGLKFSPQGRMYFSELGFDMRGSRPIKGLEAVWEGVRGGWYGFPDYSAGVPVTDPRVWPEHGPAPEFVLAHHPPLATTPTATFMHAASPMKFDFSQSERFGYVGWIFLSLFGSFSPEHPAGRKIVRVNPETGEIRDFLVAENQGSQYANSRGIARPIECLFDHRGDALYVLDFGQIYAADGQLIPTSEGGAVWRITKS